MRGKGFTLIELIVVISIVTTLAGILLPALVRAREQGRRAVCMNNLHNIGIALHMYQEDFDGFYPGNNVEYAQLYTKKYIETAKTFWCPSSVNRENLYPKTINSATWNNSYSFVFGLSTSNNCSAPVPVISDNGCLLYTSPSPRDRG